ncbi:MAG: DUF4115 domain-containing protein [Candidatus Omnitrophica bacterium]|nr:DUF4115 domain-containing protein [Candidatus Omnitrophota bacterium]
MSDKVSIGKQLSAARTAKKLSLDDVHSKLKIHPGILEKLEKNDFESLSGGAVYAKGFLKRYAEYLGISSATVLSEFELMGVSQKPVEIVPAPKEPQSGQARTPKKTIPVKSLKEHLSPAMQWAARHRKTALKILIGALGIALVGGLLVVSGAAVGRWIKDGPARRERAAEMRAAAQKSRVPKTADTQKASPSTKKQAASAAADPAMPAVQTAKSTEGSPYINAPDLDNYPRIPPQDPLMLDVRATKDVWLRLSADGEILFESILRSGEHERWKADRSIEMKLGRPEGVELTLNGFALGQPGGGQAKEVRLTHQGMEQIR